MTEGTSQGNGEEGRGRAGPASPCCGVSPSGHQTCVPTSPHLGGWQLCPSSIQTMGPLGRLPCSHTLSVSRCGWPHLSSASATWPLLTPGSLSPPVPHLDHRGDPLAEPPTSALVPPPGHFAHQPEGPRENRADSALPFPSGSEPTPREGLLPTATRPHHLLPPSPHSLLDHPLPCPPCDPLWGLHTGCSRRLERPHPGALSAPLPSLPAWLRHDMPTHHLLQLCNSVLFGSISFVT